MLAGQQDGTQTLYSSSFGTWIRMCTEFPVQIRPSVLLSDMGNHRLYFLFKSHCTWGCWMSYMAFYVLWLGYLVHRQGCFQWWARLQIMFFALAQEEKWAKTSKDFLCCITSSQPAPRFLAEQSHCFALQTISSACLSAHVPLAFTASRSCIQPFWSDQTRRHSHRVWGYVLAPLTKQEEEKPLQATFNLPNRLLVDRGLGLPWALAMKVSLCLCVEWELTVPGTGFTLEVISFGHLQPDWIAPGMCSSQELSPALSVRWF